jgi:monoamine oxidase
MKARIPTKVDVVVVGAGVAGLAAQRTLADAGLSTCVLEARDRIGGRIFTVRDPRLPYPIELGAEFLHGSAEEVVEIGKEAGLVAYNIEGTRLRMRGGRMNHAEDFWQKLHPVMKNLKADGPDESFAEFLEKKPGGRGGAESRALALQFVQGFHAADARLISMKALADGYDRVPEWLARDSADRIMTGTVVQRVGWERGSVSVIAHSHRHSITLDARAAIITAPLGVLLAEEGKEGAIHFSPDLPVIEKIRGKLTMGCVCRVVMLFRERWWQDGLRAAPKGTSLDALSFVYGDTKEFPVCWTLHPAHLPAIVAWAGGPHADAVAGLAHDEKVDRAVGAVAKNFGVTKRRLESQLVDAWTHEWDADPFSRGAYSYSLVGGSDGATQLARGVEGTIWIAGEAADAEGRNGTVHGAIGSGRAAAKRAIAAIGN